MRIAELAHNSWLARLLLPGLVLGAGLVAGCVDHPAAGEAEPGGGPAGDQRLAVVRGDLTVEVLLTGELVAEDAAALTAPNVGLGPMRIRWLAEDGAEVRSGDRLIELDGAQLESDLEGMRVEVIEAANQLASLRAKASSDEGRVQLDLEQARGAFEKARAKAEVPADVQSKFEYEQRQMQLGQARLRLEQAEQQLDSTRRSSRAEVDIQRLALERARAEVARAEEGSARLVLRAPRDGILLVGEDFREGRPLQVGDSCFAGQNLARLPNLETMMVEAQLFDVDAERVTAGMAVAAVLDAFPDHTFHGRVRSIDRVAKEASRQSLRRFFRTLIDLEATDLERMRPGMSVKVMIAETRPEVLQVPRISLDWSQNPARARLADGGWAKVELGLCGPRSCELIGGLDERTLLAAAGVAAAVGSGGSR